MPVGNGRRVGKRQKGCVLLPRDEEGSFSPFEPECGQRSGGGWRVGNRWDREASSYLRLEWPLQTGGLANAVGSQGAAESRRPGRCRNPVRHHRRAGQTRVRIVEGDRSLEADDREEARRNIVARM